MADDIKKYLGASGITKLKALISAAFVSKSQGSQNAGKVLGVGSGGNVAPAAAGVRMTKLWENASPTSSFAAQTVSLDLSGYDRVLIRFDAYAYFNALTEMYVDVGTDVYVCAPFVRFNYRQVIVNTTGIEFKDGQSQGSYASTSWATDNAMAVPLTVWGVKG